MLHDDRAERRNGVAPDYDPDAERIATLTHLLADYMTVHSTFAVTEDQLPAEDRAILTRRDSDLLISFSGRILGDTQTAYDEIDKRLREHDLYALFRESPDRQTDAPHIVHIAEGRAPEPAPAARLLPLLLFIATILSVLYTGTLIAVGEMRLSDPLAAAAIADSIVPNLWRGWKYALAILLILVPHEMGHWLMLRRYKVAASLPYFIPAFGVSPFGTFGAAIALRGTLRNRRALFDVGASGPIAGFIFAVPILFIGLANPILVPISSGLVEGNSLLYAAAKIIMVGEFVPNGEVDVLLGQFAWAGWTGLFVTALNLLPLGQLDGGHVLYSVLGDRARRLYWPLLIGMVLLTLFVSAAWSVFVVLLFLVGRFYAVPLDNITRLDPFRQRLAVITLLTFVLIFTPVPLYQPGMPGGLIGMLDVMPAMVGGLIVALQITLWSRVG